jgi:peptidoglycan/LPS O-acetylase OafA/YrhL
MSGQAALHPARPREAEGAGSPEGLVVSVQVLRGVAAVLVMLYHYAHLLGPTLAPAEAAKLPFSGGYAGVDIFFVISGFILVHATRRAEHARPLDFALRRIFRVVPLAQIATLAFYLSLTSRPGWPLLWRSLLFLPSADTDPPKFGFPVVSQEWTLSYELVFYAIFAGVLMFTHRHRVPAAAAAVLLFVLGFQWMLGGPVTLYPNGVFLPPVRGAVPPEFLGVLGNPIMLEFIVGMLFAEAYRLGGPVLGNGRRTVLKRVVGLGLVGAFVRSYLSPENPGNGLLNKGFGAACLVAGGLVIEATFPRPTARALKGPLPAAALWLGAVSYSLYLVHLGIAERIMRRAGSFLLGWMPEGAAAFAILACISLVVAGLAHRWVETPLIRAGRRLVAWIHGRAGDERPQLSL